MLWCSLPPHGDRSCWNYWDDGKLQNEMMMMWRDAWYVVLRSSGSCGGEAVPLRWNRVRVTIMVHPKQWFHWDHPWDRNTDGSSGCWWVLSWTWQMMIPSLGLCCYTTVIGSILKPLYYLCFQWWRIFFLSGLKSRVHSGFWKQYPHRCHQMRWHYQWCGTTDITSSSVFITAVCFAPSVELVEHWLYSR